MDYGSGHMGWKPASLEDKAKFDALSSEDREAALKVIGDMVYEEVQGLNLYGVKQAIDEKFETARMRIRAGLPL